MKGTVFYKMTGSGNDFIMLDGRTSAGCDWTKELITEVCDRRSGVGADGVVLLTPEGPGEVRMVYFNADGSRAAMCGNAALCATRLAAHLEMGPAVGLRLLADAGAVETCCTEPDDRAEIRFPDTDVPKPVTSIAKAPGEREIWLGTVGVPHLLVLVDDVGTVDVPGRGGALRFDPVSGPAGANVNFLSPGDPAGPWLIRTYERGVEAETLACGTGTAAAALALATRGHLELPAEFRSAGGEVLTVRSRLDGGRAADLWLGGQGRLVFRGVWEG